MSATQLFLLIASPFIGSFISASANGWPNWGKTLRSRSSCSHCHKRLQISDLIPIASFLFLAGKCRFCSSPIVINHLMAELCALLIAIISVWVLSDTLVLASVFLGWILLFGALVDFRTRLLPDGMNLILVITGLLVSFWQSGGQGLLSAALAAIIGFGVFFLISKIYLRLRGREGLGLGDAKLLAAGGAWLGVMAISWIILLACIIALFSMLITSIYSRKKLEAETMISFGPALAMAIYLLWVLKSANIGLL
ncbi:MAG: A24 family peptidase [Robiginitomaculum sp.]|nr:A24 family peptidase [Robiginitomaculum sp.]